jgi:hypothetical protein
MSNMMMMFRASGAASFTCALIPWLTPWATDLPPLRGSTRIPLRRSGTNVLDRLYLRRGI